MVMVTTLVAVYYNVIIAYSMYYMFASFQFPLPWSACSGICSSTSAGVFTHVSAASSVCVNAEPSSMLSTACCFSSLLQCKWCFCGQPHLSFSRHDNSSRAEPERALLGVSKKHTLMQMKSKNTHLEPDRHTHRQVFSVVFSFSATWLCRDPLVWMTQAQWSGTWPSVCC